MQRILGFCVLLALALPLMAEAGWLPRFPARRLGPPVDFGMVESKGQEHFCLINDDEKRTRWEVATSQRRRLHRRLHVGDIIEVYGEHGFAGGWDKKGKLKKFRPTVATDPDTCQKLTVVGSRGGSMRAVIASEELGPRSFEVPTTVVGDFTERKPCPPAEPCPGIDDLLEGCMLLGRGLENMKASKGGAGHHPNVTRASELLCLN